MSSSHCVDTPFMWESPVFNAAGDLDSWKLTVSFLLYGEEETPELLDVKSVQGSLAKEIGFYAECASINNTPKPKVDTQPLLAPSAPSLFLIYPKLTKSSAFDSLTDEFAILNVKRNALPHLISYFTL